MSEDEIKEAIKLFGREDLLSDYGIQDTDTNIEVFMSVKDMIKYYKQEQEIERLNNIISKLENELKEDYKIWMCNSRSNGKSVKFGIDVCQTHFYNRLQELKGSDK